MIDNRKVTAIILAAGNSIRFGQNKNKNFILIKNKPVVSYSLEVFNNNNYVDDIIVTVRDDEQEICNNIISQLKSKKPIKVIIGGNTRRESVYNAIIETNSDIVIINDAARPMIKNEYVDKCIEAMEDFKGVTIGVKSKDTIKITDNNNIITKTTKRENTWVVQTPQCFDRKALLKAHESINKTEEITDDCMLLEKLGYDVKIINGDYENIKITTIDDINLMNSFLKE